MLNKRKSQYDFDDYMIQTSPLYTELNEKYQNLTKQVFEIYNQIQEYGKGFKDLDTKQNQKQFNFYEFEDLRENPDIMIKNIQDILQKLFNITEDIAKSLKQRENVIYEQYDKTQLKIESDIRQNKLSQQKLAIKNECLTLKLNNLNEKFQKQEENYLKCKEQVQQLQKQLDVSTNQKDLKIAQLKKEKEEAFSQLRKFESEDIIARRGLRQQQQSNGQLQKLELDKYQSAVNLGTKSQNFFNTNQSSKQQPSLSNSNFFQNSQQKLNIDQRKNSSQFMKKNQDSMNITDPFSFPYTVQSDQFNKLVNCFSNQTGLNPNKEGRKYQNQVFQANRQKETQQQKYNYELKRLNIQLQAKEVENQKLQKQADEFQHEVKILKSQIYEEQKKKWSQEAISDKNPNLIDYYKSCLEQKNKKIKEVQKSQRKFAIQEKKLLVKEKAFENERVDYHTLTLKQAQRIEILMKIKGITKEQLEFMVKMDDIERRGLSIKQVEMVAEFLHKKQISQRDFQTMMEDDFKQRVELLKQQQKLQQNKIYFEQNNASEYH
ncbi:hypothetical protein PPERSA_12950 [Pseudocohnilembus persalinus]|uniref:Uncharacterized protein n=1 Tax=Pseudocohnilembus persalinus TaxID=266149 RepID=A0A0V0R2Q0_PSEPJ|nr:hypothetical protein PPERSA_12950 [Pseudocohnilembus persalinus]|eukprot:KRX08469.1 hypothetical protein PPERSA_12950 [Pseudocohnilembus persalinus]